MTPNELQTLCTTLRKHHRNLQDIPLADRADALALAARTLADPTTPVGKTSRKALPESSGLSPEMVDYTLRTTTEQVRPRELMHVAEEAARHATEQRRRPAELATIILAGNVFTAGLRPILSCLLLGIPALVKSSSQETVFPRLLHRALRDQHPDLANALHIVDFARDDHAARDAALAHAELILAYGDDSTMRQLRNEAPHARLVEHGHGIGAAFVNTQSSDHRALLRTALACAFDIAAYDQRGCLSPHLIGVSQDIDAFADALGVALQQVAHRLPRGPLSTVAASTQLQWRGIAQTQAALRVGDDFSIAVGEADGLLPTPAHRNVWLVETPTAEAFAERVAPLANHLKCVGVAGSDVSAMKALITKKNQTPRVCQAGKMQIPPFLLHTESHHPVYGLLV